MARSKRKSKSRRTSRKKKSKKRLLYLVAILVLGYLGFYTGYDNSDQIVADIFTELSIATGIPIYIDNAVEGVPSNSINLSKIEEGYPIIPNTRTQVVAYSGFHLSYNERHEQAEWVAYILKNEQVKRNVAERSDNFRADEQIHTGSATTDDYSGSGYDRGHLAPAGDLNWSQQAMEESFFMSNMSPQKPAFNRGAWKELEEKVRDWAVDNEVVYVVTGPVLSKGIAANIGKNRVSVPKYFYKVVLDISPPKYKSIAFLMENKELNNSLQSYAISVDELEKFTGIDFFHYIKTPDIETIESKVNVTHWDF